MLLYYSSCLLQDIFGSIVKYELGWNYHIKLQSCQRHVCAVGAEPDVAAFNQNRHVTFRKQGTFQTWVQHDVRKYLRCLNVKIRPTVLILLRVILDKVPVALCSSGQYNRKHVCAATGFEGGRQVHAELIWLGGLPF